MAGFYEKFVVLFMAEFRQVPVNFNPCPVDAADWLMVNQGMRR
jgi:hypothetical protein